MKVMMVNKGSEAVNEVVTDNLSNLDTALAAQLREIETEFEAEGPAGVRDELVQAATCWRRSTFRLRRALAQYKDLYRESKGWIQAARLIADSLGVDERTIHRWVAQYEDVSSVPSPTINALEDAGLDPAAPKNTKLLGKVLTMLPKDSEPTDDEAKDALVRAKVEMQASRPRRLGPAPKPKTRIDQSFAYLEKLYADVDPATREAELKEVVERVFAFFSMEAD